MREMKRRLALVLALALILGLGTVSALAAPEAEKTVLLDNEQVTVTVESFDPDGEWGPTFEVLLENRTDKTLFFELHDVAVDGVMCDPLWAETVPAGESVRSGISWYPEELEDIGIRYIETVSGELDISSDEDGEVYKGQVSWDLDWLDEEGPAAEPVQFSHGFAPVQALTGDLEFTVADYDPTGSYDGGPMLVFYLANRTDRTVSFAIEDVSVNGVACDPMWTMTVAAGAVAYGRCAWWQDDLDQNHIDEMQSAQFTVTVSGGDADDALAEPTAVTLDLTAGSK